MSKSTSIIIFSILFAVTVINADEILKRAKRHNIKGKLTFRVVDDDNIPVENAHFNVVFVKSDTRGDVDIFKGYTDTNGMFSAEGVSIGDMTYTIRKSGYYKTRGRYWFYQRGKGSVKNHKWQPWNPTIEVILREKKNPIPMYAKRVETEIPETNNWYGYDLMAGDWVKPYGKGEIADINIKLLNERKGIQHYWKKLIFSFENKYEGLILEPKYSFSEFVSVYNAPEIGYNNEYIFERKRTRNKIIINKDKKANEYFILKSRVITNQQNQVLSANFSKIYGSVKYAIGGRRNINFTYYFNPTPNDRNLEFEPKKNLFPDQQGKVDWP